MNRTNLLSLFLLAGFCIPGWGAADPAGDIFGKMDRAAGSFRAMTADLKQTSHTAVINDDSVQSGLIRMKRVTPGDSRVLVSFTQPDPRSVLIQGQTVDIFLPKTATEQEYNLGRDSTQIEQFLLLGFGTTRQDLEKSNLIAYGGLDTVNGKPAIRIELTPKHKEVLQRVQKIELWVSPETALPLQHKIFQPGGDYILFQFTNVKMVVSLPDSELRLKLPKNVKIERIQQ